MPFVKEIFLLSNGCKQHIRAIKPEFGFNGFGEAVYYRTYSRKKKDGTQEHFSDSIIRVVEGIISVRKDHHVRNHLPWDDEEWQKFGERMGITMMEMRFLPPGRGLWACGSNVMYERGSAACNNCGVSTTCDLVLGCTWTMDMLMCGVGVGSDTAWKGEDVIKPDKTVRQVVKIEDSRQGWVNSLKRLLLSYMPPEGEVYMFPTFDYSGIRPKGSAIKGFGGTASGPDPLIKLHNRVEVYLDTYISFRDRSNNVENIFEDIVVRLRKQDHEWMNDDQFSEFVQKVRSSATKKSYDSTRCVVDILNAIGACVVAGNIRRSSELIMGIPGDETFLNLKNYEINPERSCIGWMSNNTVRLSKTEEFSQYLPSIARRIRDNGEPGIYNQINVHRYGRYRLGHHPNEKWTREFEEDLATLVNPCGEIALEPFELCNLAEVFLPRCMKDGVFNEDMYLEAVVFATFYTSTISLLPTEWQITNRIIARNRRTGVSMSGVADVYSLIPFSDLTRLFRLGYKKVREENTHLAQMAGVAGSLRVTTIKPSGTISQMVGVSSGMHFPTFRYAIRRMRVSEGTPFATVLIENGYPHEKDVYSDNTIVFQFPIDQGKTRSAEEVLIWEQFALLATLQREWSDNCVSCTIYFNPQTESDQIEFALAQYVPVIKSCSMLPHTRKGVYAQAPYECITQEKYEELKEAVQMVDWGKFCGSDGEMPKYCTKDTCVN